MINAHGNPVQIIVAVDTEGGFGKDGKIPWNIPEDMKRFKEMTKDSVCIMGRGTYNEMVQMKKDRTKEIPGTETVVVSDDIPLLPGRESFVLTSDVNNLTPGATTTSSITEAINRSEVSHSSQIFILGGRKLFVEALSRPCIVHMTIVKGDAYGCGDAQRFPIDVLNKSYEIVGGKETDLCYYVTYHPLTQQTRRFNETYGFDVTGKFQYR